MTLALFKTWVTVCNKCLFIPIFSIFFQSSTAHLLAIFHFWTPPTERSLTYFFPFSPMSQNINPIVLLQSEHALALLSRCLLIKYTLVCIEHDIHIYIYQVLRILVLFPPATMFAPIFHNMVYSVMILAVDIYMWKVSSRVPIKGCLKS